MKRLPEHDARRTSRNRARTFGTVTLALLLGLSMAALSGCANQQEGSSSGQAPTPTGEAALGATSPISLTWNAQDSCITFNPQNTSIHVGDRVNFTTSSETSVTVTIPAGLFSAGDTTIVVARGGNNTSPTAQALGTYPLSSDPRACPSPTAGGGPSIIVDAGTTP